MRTLAAVTLVWALLAWPLPRHAANGIPSSSQNIELHAVRTMMPGDHLQLLYHFRLAREFLTGRSPWFHNVYEFNTGEDRERYLPGSYFVPFSLLFALLDFVLPTALAWNLVGLLSLWGTFLATRAYASRFGARPAAAAFGALFSVLLPIRWVNLLGGSPAGFAMLWTPVVALGIDGAVRQGSLRQGAMAGLALLLACWGDLQVFFFTTLAVPLWALLAALDSGLLPRPRWPALRQRIPALLAAGAGVAAAAAYRALRHAHLAASEMAGGREWSEVGAFSPTVHGLWQWAAEGLQSHVYLGLSAALLTLGAGWAVACGRTRCERAGGGPSAKPADAETVLSDAPRLPAWPVYGVLVAALAGTVVLALGTQGPFQGLALRVARRLVPPYAMVRQTAKIFVLMPTLLALAGAFLAEGLWRRGRGARALLAGLALLGLAEYNAQVRATVCRLDLTQGGYAAVARDAEDASVVARALVLPIWPGEAAEASLYQLHAQTHGIRLVNGYSPVVRRDYLRRVFEPLQAVNQGFLGDVELELLASMGVGHVLLHEDLFPEKVSPFPVTWTRDRLLAHNRLTPLGRDGPVWAFRIEPVGRADVAPATRRAATRFPTRVLRFDRLGDASAVVADPSCHGGAHLRMVPESSPVTAGPWRVAPAEAPHAARHPDGAEDADEDAEEDAAAAAEALHWQLRLRGAGRLVARTAFEGAALGETAIEIDSADTWRWHALPLPPLPAFGRIGVEFAVVRGSVDADLGLLVAGGWEPELPVGARLRIAAEDCFHAGFSEAGRAGVTLRPDWEADRVVLYGPRLPLEPGRYQLTLEQTSPAAPGTTLGRLALHVGGGLVAPWTPVQAGETPQLVWRQEHNLPVTAWFHYNRAAPLRITSLAFERLPDDSPAAQPASLPEIRP